MYDAMTVYFISFIVGIVVSCIFGAITKAINEGKGYYGGFAWGFWLGWIGILVVALKQPIPYTRKESIIVPAKTTENNNIYTPQLLSDGSWNCSCGRHNARYISSCVCGLNKTQIGQIPSAPNNTDKDAKDISALKEYKNLLDSGVLTQEEFEAKKKEILSR